VLLVAALGCGAFVSACDAPEEPAGTGADNPVDPRSLEGPETASETTSTRAALMTAPARSPRTIAAMMFDLGGGPRTPPTS